MGSAVALLLMVIGGLVLFVGSIMFLIAAYAESFLWALGCFLFAPVQLIFLIMYWKEAKQPFFVQLSGGALILLGIALGAMDLKSAGSEQAKGAHQAVEAAPAPAPRVVVAPPPDTRTRAERILGECASELGLLCSGKNGEKAQMRCLRANEDSLRGPCRAAIDEPATP